MSSHQRQFVPFQALEPDTVDFDNPSLDAAENVTPSYGAYRPIEQLVKIAEVTDSNPLRGGYCHLSGTANPVIKVPVAGTPVGTNAGNWYDKDLQNIEGAVVTDYAVEMVRGPGIDDTTWVRSGPVTDTSSPSLDAIWWLFAETPRTPALSAPNEVTFRIRVRTKMELGNGVAPKLNYTLYDTSTADTIKTGTLSLSATETEDWQDFEIQLSIAEATDVDDWTTLELKLEPYWNSETAAGAASFPVPVVDEYYDTGWKADDGLSTDMFEHVNAHADGFPTVPDYDVYVDSAYVTSGKDSTAIFKLDQCQLPSDPDTTLPTFNAYVTGTAGNVSVKLRVIQPVAAEDADDEDDSFWLFSDLNFQILAEGETNNISQDQATPTLTTVSATPATAAAYIAALDPLKAVYVAITVNYGGDEANVGEVTLTTTSGGGWGGWSLGKLDDDNPATLVQLSATATPKSGKFNLSEGSSRSAKTDHKVILDAKTSTTDGNVKVELWHNTKGKIASTGFFDLTTSFATYTKGFNNTNQIGEIPEDGYGDLYLKVFGSSGDLSAATLQISEMEFQYPGDSGAARVYEVWADVGRSDRFEFSHIQMEITDAVKANVGDFNETYVGTDSDLYEVTSLGFGVATRSASDYNALGVDLPRLWSFTSWGDDVIATNYADVVQRKSSGGALFSDLISGTYIPQARFCAVVGGSLVLADINPASTGYADGKSYHLWCSNLLDPTTFSPADYDNQSAIFPLISKPGAITGLVGGEYGWVFKRNSVWRMTYVGLPPIFQFDLVIEGVGCSHPQSIVSAGGDVYFWGGGAIHRIGQEGYQRLSGQRIEKYIFDTSYEPSGLLNVYSNDTRENDAVVWGSFDAYSGLIWWLYRTTDEADQAKLNKAVVYSVIEDRFTTISDDSLDLTLLLAQQNVATDEPVLNRSMQAFKYADTTTEYLKFIDDTSYAGTLKTKIITPTSWGSQVGKDAEIVSVRPMYISQPDNQAYGVTALPNFTITITGAQDPTMRIGKQTRTVTRVSENRQGWIPVQPLTCEFWQFEVTIPELYRATVKEFLGLQIMTREAGDG